MCLVPLQWPEDADAVATLAQKIDTEKRAREMCEQNGLPQPDHVEYGFTCIRLFFEEPKVVLVIDIDEPGDADGSVDTEGAGWRDASA